MKKIGRPLKSDDERRSVKLYVCCRPKDRGVALRDALRAARDAYEKKADAQDREAFAGAVAAEAGLRGYDLSPAGRARRWKRIQENVRELG